MKFVIEALGLTAGGGKTGLMRLLPALADRGRHHTFVAVLADLEEFRVLERSNLKVILQQKPASLLRRHFRLQRTIPLICAGERADALLCLGNFGPLRPLLPTVVLLHNAHYVTSDSGVEENTTLRERLITWYGRRYLRRIPERVRLVVQTEHMKRRVIEAHRIAPARVIVIPDGDALPREIRGTATEPQKRFSSPTPVSWEKSSEELPDKGPAPERPRGEGSGPGTPFTFLCVARYYPHKNLEVLVEAMKRLSPHSRRPARCLLTIHPDQHPGARKLLRRIVSERLGQILVNLGPLDGNEVVEAYRSADALILPSLLESFGRTYLEAMRFNLPILTSDRDFAHEVCGGAALYFDPLDPESVAQSMARIMIDGELRDRLAAERQRIPIPSWEDVAARFVDVLERAARDHDSPGVRCRAPVVAAETAPMRVRPIRNR